MSWTSGPGRASTPAWKRLRKRAIRELGNQCAKCGADGDDVRLELDHIIPVAEGGQDDLDNAQLLCPPCHKPKTQQEAARGRARKSGRRKPPMHPSDALLP